MKSILLAGISILLFGIGTGCQSIRSQGSEESRVYEMRTYYAAPGKLDALNARFRDHTLGLFGKHGIKNVGYWMPTENPDSRLVYLLSYPNREAAQQSWKNFMADPDWQAAHKASEANGKLVAKMESVYMKSTDYSPKIKIAKSSTPRIFELRTYKAAPGKLDALNARFRDHTVNLFSQHGMENLGYWMPLDKDTGSDDTLIYLLAHKSREAAAASFKAFGENPKWVEARTASEKSAGGSLTAPKGVKSVFMKPTDYSPMK